MAILCEADDDVARALGALIGGQVQTVPTLGQVLDLVDGQPGRQLVVLGRSVQLEQVIGFMRLVRACRPATVVLLLRDGWTAAEQQRASAAGIRAVLAAGDAELIAAACRDALGRTPGQWPVVAATTRSAPGQIITVLSARAGCGSTTLATNLAAALQADRSERVCLLDLDLELGDVATALQLVASTSVANAVGRAGGFGPAMIAELVSRSADGLHCIAAPTGPGEASRISAELVTALLDGLTACYSQVVVDLPARLGATALAALDRADQQIVVSTPERPALKNLRRTLDTLDLLGYPRSIRSVVFNRSEAGRAIRTVDVEALLRTPIAVHVPSSPDVPAAINRGLGLVSASPQHPVSRAISQLASQIVQRRTGG